MTLRQWEERARRLPTRSWVLGLVEGDRVAILAHNAVERMAVFPATANAGPAPLSAWPAAEMCRQQTVFDRNEVSCHAAALGAKQHPSPAAPRAGDLQKNELAPRSPCHRALCDLVARAFIEALPT